jgi:hypothetical protein
MFPDLVGLEKKVSNYIQMVIISREKSCGIIFLKLEKKRS